MDTTEVRRESRLAVFEHVVEKRNTSKRKKFKTYRLESDESSPSESELIIDEDMKRPTKKMKNPIVKFSEEPLSLQCEWSDCYLTFNSWNKFNDHLIKHAETSSDKNCQWINCNLQLASLTLFRQHVSYHGYLWKLRNIGNNVLSRNKLPDCKQTGSYLVRTSLDGYTCEWENCSIQIWTIYEFILHVAAHVNYFGYKSKGNNDLIICGWKGCGSKFATKCRLGEHVRTHTKEKVIGCPTCCLLFANKAKFCDHRRRQSLTDLQSFQCSQCLKLFPTEGILRDHIRCHINHYKCTMCDMTCAVSSVLAKHIRFKHMNDRSYECEECGKRFIEKHNLRTHMKTHQDDSFKCEHCDFECRSAVGLRTHCRNKHDHQRLTYECHCCKKGFLRGSYLTRHLMKVHKYHWPSGHSRFRYRKDQDGIYRLQTVRYESLEVTEEMIKSESRQSNISNQNVSYSLRYDTEGQSSYELFVTEKSPEVSKENDVVITINDVDEHGNVLKSEVVNSTDRILNEDEKIVIVNNPLPDLDEDPLQTDDLTTEEQNTDMESNDSKVGIKIEVDSSEEQDISKNNSNKKIPRRKKKD